MKKFLKNYWFILFMLTGIVGGCLVGAFAPAFGGKIKFLGTLFINMMFCVVVPMVFCSIASAIANMKSVKRAGKIMGVTIATFLVTAAIAGVIMYIVCRIFPLVDGHYTITEGEIGDTLGFGDMIVNFFTKPDFMELLSGAVRFRHPDERWPRDKDRAGARGYHGLHHEDREAHHLLRPDRLLRLLCQSGVYLRPGAGRRLQPHAHYLLRHELRVHVRVLPHLRPVWRRQGRREDHVLQAVPPGGGVDIVMPLGATMHMDGSAMGAIIKVAFLFGVFGLDFTTEKAILAIIVAVFSSVAMSGIPGGGGTGELVVCTIFFPDQLAVAYPIALAIGNLVDPPATMVNSAGDYVVSFIVSRYVDGKDWLQKAIAKKRESKAIEQ